MGFEPRTRSERGAWNKAVSEIKQAQKGSAPAEIAAELERRFRAYERRWPEIDVTLPAVAKHWELLGQAQRLRGPPAEQRLRERTQVIDQAVRRLQGEKPDDSE